MRNLLLKCSLILSLFILIIACKKETKVETQPNEISAEVLQKILKLGFSDDNVIMDEGDYIVEGDIRLSTRDLDAAPNYSVLRVGEVEQYHTTNTVDGPREITVSVSSRLPSDFVAAADEAIRRYNAENLSITFRRVSGDANIDLVRAGGNYLASAGFPTSGGDPYGQVKLNAQAMSGQPLNTKATIIAHELGHCIGMRHTDYFDRSISCGGQKVNEGESNVGAIHIPGTPTGSDNGSWMLSCIGSGQNRPFTNNDKTALAYLY